MKKASHHAMGHLLYQALAREGIGLDRELFVLGNLLPDYMPEIILMPHFSHRCEEQIDLFCEVLAAQRLESASKLPPEYSLRLGILCHYVTDSFCFSHTPAFGRNLKKHAAYERRLNEYFRAHYSAKECLLPARAPMRCACAADAARGILRFRGRYRAARHAYETDLRFAFTACLEAIRQLVALSAAREETGYAPFRFTPFAAEKYAYKNGVCHRRIVPRRAWCAECPA